LREKNTLFDDLIKNLENNNELYNLVRKIVLDEYRISFNRANPIIDLGFVCGIFITISRSWFYHDLYLW
jgi:hypothetical protein